MLRLLILTGIVLLLDIYVFQAVRLVTRDISGQAARVIYVAYWSITAISLLILFSAIITGWNSWPKIIRVYSFSFIIVFLISKFFILIFLLTDDIGRIIRWGYTQVNGNVSIEAASTGSSPENGITRSQFM